MSVNVLGTWMSLCPSRTRTVNINQYDYRCQVDHGKNKAVGGGEPSLEGGGGLSEERASKLRLHLRKEPARRTVPSREKWMWLV